MRIPACLGTPLRWRPKYYAPESFRHGFAWTMLGNSSFAASSWLTIVVLARFGSKELVGTYAYALAVVAPVFLLLGLNIRSIMATDARAECEFATYRNLRYATTAMAAAVCTVLAISLESGRFRDAIVLVAVGRVSDSLSDLYYGRCQQAERMRPLATSLALRAVLGLGAFSCALLSTGSLSAALLAMNLAWLAVLFVFDIPVSVACGHLVAAASATHATSKYGLGHLLRLALPMGVGATCVSLYLNAPRYAIAHYVGESALGVFAGLSALVLAGNTVMSALANAASPRLARYYAAGDRLNFLRLFSRTIACALVLGTVGIAIAVTCGRWVVCLVYGAEYSQDNTLFVLLMISAAVMYLNSALGVAVTAMRCFGWQATFHVANTGVLFALAMTLVQRHGLRGGACSLIIGSAFIGSAFAVLTWLKQRRLLPVG